MDHLSSKDMLVGGLVDLDAKLPLDWTDVCSGVYFCPIPGVPWFRG